MEGLFAAGPGPAGRSVHMVEDEEVEIGVTRRGARPQGQACQLTISVNGQDAISFLEDAGPNAPLAATVDLSLPGEAGQAVLDAMRTRPWQHADCPIIAYARSGAAADGPGPRGRVAYLVKNRPIDEVIAAIRATLDLPHPV